MIEYIIIPLAAALIFFGIYFCCNLARNDVPTATAINQPVVGCLFHNSFNPNCTRCVFGRQSHLIGSQNLWNQNQVTSSNAAALSTKLFQEEEPPPSYDQIFPSVIVIEDSNPEGATSTIRHI